MRTDVLFSSKKDDWTTPQDFYDKLNSEFHFTLDPAADDINHKCNKYYTKADSGLMHEWGGGDGILQSAVWQGYSNVGE